MVNVAIAIPYRKADDRRAELFDYTTRYLSTSHAKWPRFIGASPDGPFNRGAAINDAARKAGDWDALVVCDADNICDRATLEEAVDTACATGKVVYPFSTYIYLDEFTSNRLMRQGVWFIAPELHPANKFATTVRHRHYSGIQVIPRSAWDSVGGFIELTGWGAEDAIMDTIFSVFADGSEWLPGGAYHLWHPARRNDPLDKNNVLNHRVWAKVTNIARRRNPELLRQYLDSIGHTIP